MKKHDEAVKFAYENRMNVADSVLNILEMKYINQLIVNCNHNIIELHDGYYYHHKGSISSFNKYAIIAGSRGDYSYIVRCIPVEDTLYSVSHGAGRKWPRHLCKGRLETKYNKEQIKTSQLGSVVITDKKELLYEEASEAYKNIEDVIDVLLDYECIEIIARLRPMVTYKC